MRSTVNSKVMIGSKPELNWKDVTKGKRSRKAVPRRFTKSGNISPKRVGDFSGSESDKLAALSVVGQRKSGKSEDVPIKKRRHLLGSRASAPSPKKNSSLTGVDDLARAVYDKEFNSVTLSKRDKDEISSWDFSGIELLASAATMDFCADNPKKVDCGVEDHSVPGSSDASVVVSESKLGLKCNESGNSSSTTTICADNANSSDLDKSGTASRSPCVSSKVDRRFWDLNTDMEAWVEPYADTHVEGLQENSEELPNPAVSGVESFALKQEDKLGDVTDRTSSSKTTSLEKGLVKIEKISRSSDAGETPNRAIKKDVDENKPYQVVCGDAVVETPALVIRGAAILDGIQTKIQGAEITGAAVSALKIATAYEKDSQNSYEPQGNMTSLRKTTAFITCKREHDDSYNSKPDEVNCLSSVSKSGYLIASGTITKDEKCVDSTVQSDKTCVSDLMIAESHSRLEQEKLVAKHEDNLPNEGLGGMKLEDSCNSYSRPHDDLTTSVGKVDSTMDPCPDSPYEDGELRESCMYDWEENDLETELVDYESDGRKGDSSDAADNIGSEVVEGGSEGSHGTEGNGEKKNTVKYPLRRNFTKDDSKNNETSAKKESDGGSGTTGDHLMEMAIDDSRRRYLTDRSGMDDCKALMGEYVSRMAREKLQSRTEAADDKGAFFLPHNRSHHLGGFRDRDVTPEKYAGKYTPASYRGGRDGINQWNNWGSRSRYSSTYQGNEVFNTARPRRSFTGDVVDKFDGLDFHEPRQTGDYLSRDMHRPLVRTRSPVERDNRFSMGNKMPPARRINSYRSSAHYPQSGDFEPVPNGPAAPVCFSRMPGRDRSFSPNSVKEGHMPSNRKRSRSRSRTRSPRAWHSYREASFRNRRHSGSPDFRSEARMERVKVPFHKPKFTPEYREGYVSPSRGRFPSQRNSRWVGDRSFGDNHDRSFGDNHFKRRRSPTGDFRLNNQSTNPSGRFKSDEYYRPMNRPRRFPFVENDDRDTEFEAVYGENKGEMHRATQHENGGYFKRSQRDVNNDFEMRNDFGTRNLNNEEGVRAPAIRDVAQVQGAGEDKKETEI